MGWGLKSERNSRFQSIVQGITGKILAKTLPLFFKYMFLVVKVFGIELCEKTHNFWMPFKRLRKCNKTIEKITNKY